MTYTPGPWYLVMRPCSGYAVRSADRRLIAEFFGPHLSVGEHRRNATACAQVPDMIEALQAAENYFGDLPSSDKVALHLHGQITRVLNRIGVALAEVG